MAKLKKLRQLHESAKPEWFVPVHGELRHLVAHRQLAIDSGIEPRKALLATDGDEVIMEDAGLSIVKKVCEGAVYLFSGVHN